MTHQLLAGSIVALALAAGGTRHPSPTDFSATLTGAGERPTAVTTQATGNATITIDDKAQTFSYTVTVANIADVTGAHLHIGKVDGAGPPAVGLLPKAPAPGAVNGSLSSGTVAAADLMGGLTFDDVAKKIRSGEAYVNVHTKTHPGGEIRGQLAPKM